MTSREAFEEHMIMFTGRDMEYHQRNQTTGIKHALEAWQAAIEWASKQAIDAVDKVIPEEAPEYQFCQEAIKESLS